MNSTQHISQEDLTLYSMQALVPGEEAEMNVHLDSCATCRSMLADVLADVSLIGLSTPQTAIPDGARERFIAATERTPHTANKIPRSGPVLVEHEPRGEFGWLGWVVAAAAIVAALYLGYRDHRLQDQLNESRGQVAQLTAQNQQMSLQAQQLQRLMDTLSSPEAKQVTLTETKRPTQPVGHAIYMAKNGALIFTASNLRPVPHNKTYELWLIPANGKAPIPAGLFRPDAVGSASVVMPTLPAGIDAKAFGVTVEDAQGSATPTLPIVMSGS